MAGKLVFSGTLWEAAAKLTAWLLLLPKQMVPPPLCIPDHPEFSHWPALAGNHTGKGILGDESCFPLCNEEVNLEGGGMTLNL